MYMCVCMCIQLHIIFNYKEENFSVEDQLNVSEYTIVALHIIHPTGILFTTTTRYSCLITLQGKDKYYRYLKIGFDSNCITKVLYCSTSTIL